MKLTAAVIAILGMFLTGCGKAHVNHSASPYDNRSSSSSASRDGGEAPLGRGGYRKTGSPYQVAGHWYYPLATAAGYSKTGTASWYGREFHGKKTANGEYYDMHAMSAAHTTLPMPTMAKVTNLDNGRAIVVRINDRGPFVKNRIIDLSYAAAKALGYERQGTAPVRVEALGGAAATPAMAGKKVSAPVLAASPRPAYQPQAPAPRTPAASHGSMYVQLGAFSMHSNAERLTRSLADEYPSARIYARDGVYSGMFRVRLGPFNDVKQIEETVLSLQGRGYTNAIVVIE
ncbi:MAG: septal ring lytic transglycosylase RlpA family protein [Mariprofundaceae bacterium]|nr:septal ring lytic transglycosylase RlpA family protein [Mariprofundaceae bacterium]